MCTDRYVLRMSSKCLFVLVVLIGNTISTSGPPSVDTTHFSPASHGSASHSPNTPQLSVSFSQSNPTPLLQPHLPPFFSQQQPLHRVDSVVSEKPSPAQTSSITVFHNRSDNVEPSGVVLLTDQPDISSSTSAFQIDYGSSLPSWLSRTVSVADNSIAAPGTNSDNDTDLGSFGTSCNDSCRRSHVQRAAVGSCTSLRMDDYLSSCGLSENSSSVLSTVVVTKQPTAGHSHFASSFAPIHLPQTIMSSGLNTSSSETSAHRLPAVEVST